jgi:hypothetical protein
MYSQYDIRKRLGITLNMPTLSIPIDIEFMPLNMMRFFRIAACVVNTCGTCSHFQREQGDKGSCLLTAIKTTETGNVRAKAAVTAQWREIY